MTHNTPTVSLNRDVPNIPMPDALWHGWWAKAAEKIGKRTWEVWSGLVAGVSALAHRNLHWFYFDGPLYGNLYILLLARTGAGKTFPVRIAAQIAEPSVLVSSGVSSGEGFASILTRESLEMDKGQHDKEVQGCPAMLVLREWTKLTDQMNIPNSTLAENHNQLFDGFEHWSPGSRSTHRKTGGRLTIAHPSLTIFGTTTFDSFARAKTLQHLGSGFLNRYLLVPGQSEWEPYTGQNYQAGMATLPEWKRHHTWGVGRNLNDAYTPDAWEQFLVYQDAALARVQRDFGLHGWGERLHVHYHHLALLSAWVNAEQKTEPHVTCNDVAFAESYCDVFQQLVPWLISYQVETEPTHYERRLMDKERAIMDSVRRFYLKATDGKYYLRSKLAKNMNRQGSYRDMTRTIDTLVKVGQLVEEQVGNKTYIMPASELV